MVGSKRSLFYVSVKNLIMFLVIPIMIIYLFSNILLVRYVYKDMINNNNMLFDQISNSINNNLDISSLVIANIANDTSIDSLIYKWSQSDDWYEKYDISARIDQLISAHLNYNSMYEGVVYTLKDGRRYYYGNTTYLTDFLSNSDIDTLVNNKVNIVNNYINKDKLLMMVPIRNKVTMVDNVWMIINEDMFKIEQSLGDTSLRDVIIVKDGIMEFKKNKIQLKEYRLYYNDIRAIDNFNFELIAAYEITEMITLLFRIIVLFLVGIVIIIFALIIYYKRYKKTILMPIKNTLDNINYIRENVQFKEIFDGNSVEELDSLNIHLNEMIREINNLIQENKRIGEERLDVEVKVLQSQITSHFIFNTLNSIRVLALINKDNEVANAIKNFISLLRNNFTKGNMHTLETEVNNIENYCKIMKLRFGDKFNISIELQDDLKDLKILKLISQPIIENSITHGFVDKEGNGNIIMNIKSEDNKIIINIEDNGGGMTEDAIDEIFKGTIGGIAIYNSNRRIKLYYGEEYGITIESKSGQYTRTTVILPIIN